MCFLNILNPPHDPRPIENIVLFVKYENGNVENLRVVLSDEVNIHSVNGGDHRSLSTVCDFRMARIVETTLIFKHRLTDFPLNEV